jgi:SAM-dependent methyltransferase
VNDLPSIQENISTWNNPATWDSFDRGDAWSTSWGNPDNQWLRVVLPRIQRYVPAGRILEIAPGFGRWTNYLKELCSELIVVDLNELCIQKCKERFLADSHIDYYVNDGKSLSMVSDGSIDFAFSFDSLVHAEADVIDAYLTQLAKKLKPNGVAWLHHSNVGSYRRLFQDRKNFHIASYGFTKLLGFQSHFRSWSMTAEGFEAMANKAGLSTISQELVNWETKPRYLIDCISVCTPKGSFWAGPNRTLKNHHFMDDATYSSGLYSLYGKPPSQQGPAKR